MKKAISHLGWFVWVISGLATGDPEFIKDYPNNDGCTMTISEIERTLLTLRDAGFTRESRRGWETIHHQVLGTISFKSGYDFRSTKPYLIMRLNGRVIIREWPNTGHIWIAPDHVSESDRRRVEAKLRL